MEKFSIEAPLEVRSLTGKPPRLIGLIPYNKNTAPPRRDRLKPGCFRSALRSKEDIIALWDHNSSWPLGATRNGSLVLKDGPLGLEFQILPNMETTWGLDAVASVKRGDTTGCSFAGYIKRAERGQDGFQEISEIDLLEISPTSMPAFPDSSVEARSRFNKPNDRNTKMQNFEYYSNPWDPGLSPAEKRKHLMQRQADIVRYRRSLLDGAAAADRDLTDAENDNISNMDAEYRRVTRALENYNAQSAMERSMEMGGTYHAVEPQGRIEFSRDEAEAPFESFGKQLAAVAYAAQPGGRTDPRLYQAAATGLGEGVPSEGGFLIQKEFSAELLRRILAAAPVASRCYRVPLGENSNGTTKLPVVDETSRANGSRLGGVQAYWVSEAATVTPTKPKFRSMNLELRKLMALCYATEEMLADSSVLGKIIGDAFVSEMAFKFDDAIINENGAGKPLGIMPSGALLTVSKEDGQAANTFLYDNTVNMWARMPARNRKNAVWLINQDIEPQLYTMTQIVGVGGVPVFLPAGGASVEPYATLFTRPIIPIEQCETLGTTGDILLADLSEYIFIDKGGVRSDSSMHVRFIYDEMTFRFTYRVDGQPILNSPVTPYKGTNTLSPFVALETRN